MSARKWKSRILSEHAFEVVWGWQSRVGRECEEQFNIIWGFLVTLLVSYSFACHVSWKVKFFGKVANRRLSEDSRGRQCSSIFAALSFHEPNQLSAVDHCGSRSQSMKSCCEGTISFKALWTINSAESFSADNLPVVVYYFFQGGEWTRRTNRITIEVIIYPGKEANQNETSDFLTEVGKLN